MVHCGLGPLPTICLICLARLQKKFPEHAAGAQSAASSSSGTPGWLIAAIVVPIAVLLVAVAALATLMIRKRQLDKRKQAQDPDLLKVRRASMCGA